MDREPHRVRDQFPLLPWAGGCSADQQRVYPASRSIISRGIERIPEGYLYGGERIGMRDLTTVVPGVSASQTND